MPLSGTPRLPEPRRELVALLGIERRAVEQEKELWELHDESGRANSRRSGCWRSRP